MTNSLFATLRNLKLFRQFNIFNFAVVAYAAQKLSEGVPTTMCDLANIKIGKLVLLLCWLIKAEH